jgi:TusA-related sulfurtransferase
MKLIAVLLLSGLPLMAQDMNDMKCPMHDQHMKSQHQADVEKQGDGAMGFPHGATTHHFRVSPDGGTIEVTVNDPKDTQNIDAIRGHLNHIATMFSNGDFSIPMFVHSQTPPGVTEMKDKRNVISYTFEKLETGGRVRISTNNQDALNAIHDFLNFQIADHHTGDNN